MGSFFWPDARRRLFLYGGTTTLLFWIPDQWGSVDEDGNWTPLRQSVGVFVGGIGAFLSISAIFDLAARLSELERFRSIETLASTMRLNDLRLVGQLSQWISGQDFKSGASIPRLPASITTMPHRGLLPVFTALSDALQAKEELSDTVHSLEEELARLSAVEKETETKRSYLEARLASFARTPDTTMQGRSDELRRLSTAAGIALIDSEKRLQQLFTHDFRWRPGPSLPHLPCAASISAVDGAFHCLGYRGRKPMSSGSHTRELGRTTLDRNGFTFEPLHSEQLTVLMS